jgi:hypothetical protein
MSLANVILIPRVRIGRVTLARIVEGFPFHEKGDSVDLPTPTLRLIPINIVPEYSYSKRRFGSHDLEQSGNITQSIP